MSDHTPVDEDQKQMPFAEAEPGATGLELLLPLTLKWGAAEETAAGEDARPRHQRRRRASSACRRAASSPARPPTWWCSTRRQPFRVTPEALKSQGKNTPFLGYELAGRVRTTIVAGSVVYEQREALVALALLLRCCRRAARRPTSAPRRLLQG